MARSRMLLLAVLFWSAAPAIGEVPECPPVEAGADLPNQAPAEGDAPSVLLILPKGADGEIATEGLELAPSARLLESRFSALMCATVARVGGAPGESPASLIVRLPPGAAAVLDDVYLPAADPDPSAPNAHPQPLPDAYRAQQWALDALGVDAAHELTRGGGARVAVLDTRANEQHAELRGVRVAGEMDARAGQHGTLVAGIIGAARGNGAGITGIAPDASLLSVPVCEATPSGDACRLFRVLSGLDTAWAERAQIVNVSLVGPANRALERAVRRLDTLGVAIVAASGNRATGAPTFPAAYPWVIGVAATDRGRQLAPTGSVVDLTAPGVEIVSTSANGGYAFASGSSLAAAHASGALALLTAASGGDVARARLAMFGAARRSGPRAPAALGPLCDALARLGRSCGGP
jgi:subtilisin family serine protease